MFTNTDAYRTARSILTETDPKALELKAGHKLSEAQVDEVNTGIAYKDFSIFTTPAGERMMELLQSFCGADSFNLSEDKVLSGRRAVYLFLKHGIEQYKQGKGGEDAE